ncbi:MAG: hypothetical protein AB8G96_15630 [Phycisphaerales bacterium]
MHHRPPVPPPTRRGIGAIEIILLIVVVVVLLGLSLPMLSRSRHCTASIRDAAQQKQIHQAMLVAADDDHGRLPRPSRMLARAKAGTGAGAGSGAGAGANHETDSEVGFGAGAGFGKDQRSADHTAALFSAMVTRDSFAPHILISPIETNPAVSAFATYDYDVYQPAAGVLWDPAIRADLTAAKPGRCHVSFHHTVLCGERVEARWRASTDATFPVLSTRAPFRGATSGPTHDRSYTLQMMPGSREWAGNVVYADNSTSQARSTRPGRVGYSHGDAPRVRDNIFHCEFGTSADAWAAGDAWLAHTGPVGNRPATLADTRTALAEALRP